MRFLLFLPLVVESLVPTAAEGASTAAMRQLAGPIPNPLVQPVGLVKVGNALFVMDKNAIDRVDLTTFGFSIFAGERHITGSTDGIGRAARFKTPRGIATDGTNLFVADSGSHTIRKVVIASAQVTTLAGAPGVTGSVDGVGNAARFNFPYGVAVASDGALYVTDLGNHTVRKIVPATRTVTTLAGSAGMAGSADGTGSAARFLEPKAVAADGTTLWLTDGINVRRVTIGTRAVTTVASIIESFHQITPTGISVAGPKLYAVIRSDDGDGSIVNRIYEVDPVTSAVSEFPSSPSDAMIGVTSDGTRLWITGARINARTTLLQIDIGTATTTDVGDYGSGLAGRGFVDGTGTAARFDAQGGLTSDGTFLYVLDQIGSAGSPAPRRIRKVRVATGAVTTLPTILGYNAADAVMLGGDLYVADNKKVKRVNPSTGAVSVITTLTNAKDLTFNGITTDGTHLYLTNRNCAIYKVTLPGGAVNVLAGKRAVCGYADGAGTAARFGFPQGANGTGPEKITSDGANLYVADRYNDHVRKVVIATAVVTTVGGSAQTFDRVTSVAFTRGKLYVAGSDKIQKVNLATGVVTEVTPSRDTAPDSLTYEPTLASRTRIITESIKADPGGARLYFVAFPSGVGVLEL